MIPNEILKHLLFSQWSPDEFIRIIFIVLLIDFIIVQMSSDERGIYLLFSQASPKESQWVHMSLKHIGFPGKSKLIQVLILFNFRRVQMSPNEILKYLLFSQESPDELY